MAELKSESIKMLCQGFALGIANDLRPQNKFNLLQNIRVVKEGVLESRALVEKLADLNPDPNATPHTIVTIIDKSTDSFLRIVGADTKLFTGDSDPLIEKADGFSGKPLSTVDFRPEQSIEAYLYIADENKFVKVSVSNILSDVGIIPPTKAATWAYAKPERKVVDKIFALSTVDWNNLTGSAGAPILESRVDTIIDGYLEDGPLPNFVTIIPNDGTNIQKDSIVDINNLARVVEESIPPTLKAGIATIANISYDFGISGQCTIVLSVSSADIRKDSVLKLNNAEYVRVEDVTRDSNNIPSIKTSTIGTFAVGDSVEGVSSFRVFTDVGFAIGNVIENDAIKTSIGASGVSSITRVFDIDLLNTGINGKPLTLEDILHISLIADSTKISEIQIQLDLDDGTFTKNYRYYAISPNFFAASVAQTAPVLAVTQQAVQRQALFDRAQNIYGRVLRFADSGSGGLPSVDFDDIYRRLLEDSGVTPIETTTGQAQWAEFNIRLGDFKVVGSDPTKTLSNVKAIRISINATNPLDVLIDSIWVGGAGALDTISSAFLPYNYVWRIRDPATRASSNWSPPLRAGIRITRGNISLTFPDANAIYPANYRIDIARFGGSVNEFRIVGSILNDGNPFVDTSSDRVVQDNSLAGRFSEHGATDAVFDFYKPFAILDTPKSGTCEVIGTKFTRTSGDSLNISYPRGTQIVINGIANKFYTNPIDTDRVELEKDMGNLINAKFEIQEPLLTGQSLPIIFGPTGEGFLGLFIFGLGDKNAAGTIYWLDGNSPDTMSDQNRLEITSPSEPLVTGLIYDGSPYIYTTKRAFVLQPTISSEGDFSFIAREAANSRGVFSRRSICVAADFIFFLSENADGIYRVQGNGNPQNITNGTFANLFFTSESEPELITLVDGTTIYPPDFTRKDDIQFFSTNNHVYFRFIDLNGDPLILVYSTKLSDFISSDEYQNDEINVFYKEERESSTLTLVGVKSGIGRFSNESLFEVDSESKVIPFAYDAGDSRIIKEFKEIVVDAEKGIEGYSVRNYYNNGTISDLDTNIVGDIQPIRQQQFLNLQDDKGIGKLAKNLTTVFKWLLQSGTKLYEERFYFEVKNDAIENRSSTLENGGDVGEKLWQGVIIKANTFNENKVLNYYDDENILRASLVIKHNGESTIAYSFETPFISHTIRRTSDDGILWIPIEEAYIFDREPEEADVWEGEFNTHNLTGLITIQRFGWAYRSTEDATLILKFEDGTEQIYENILPNSNGGYNKEFFFAQPKKWKACKYRIKTLGKIRVYKRDSEVWMKSFGSDQPFSRFSPIGGTSRETEALI